MRLLKVFCNVLAMPDVVNRVCTIGTYAEVLVLVLGVEPEPNLMVVL